MPRVLITGVAGFLGSHLADRFLLEGYEVIGIDNLLGGYRDNVPQGCEFHEADLRNLKTIVPLFDGVDLVIHSACTAYEGLSVFSPSLVSENTFQITANALSAAAQTNVKRFVFMSSMARYGTQDQLPFVESMIPKPQDPYGIAKFASELLVRNLCDVHGIEHVILVPHNIIGPRQKYDDPFRNVASIMINRIIHGQQPIIYGTGNQMRCFSFVDDVVNPIVQACLTDSAVGEVINIGPDNELVTINQLASIIAGILEWPLRPIYVPERPQEVFQANCSAEKARLLLGYEPRVTLRQGLTILASWIKDKPKLEFDYHLPVEIQNLKTPNTWTQKLI